MPVLKAGTRPLGDLAEFLVPFARLVRRSESRHAIERYTTGLLADTADKTAAALGRVVPATNSQQLQELLTRTAWDAACIPFPETCVAAVATAEAAAASADIAEGVAIGDYINCMNPCNTQIIANDGSGQAPPSCQVNTSGSGSATPTPGPNGVTCYQINWEISYDNGATWIVESTTISCV